MLTAAAAAIDLGPSSARDAFTTCTTRYWAVPSRGWHCRSCGACVRSSMRMLSCYPQFVCARPAAIRRAVAFHVVSASEVFATAGLKRPSAQSSASRQRYSTRGPKWWNRGPPPLVAIVANVLGLVGYPSSVKAAAVLSRGSNVSGLAGIKDM